MMGHLQQVASLSIFESELQTPRQLPQVFSILMASPHLT